MSQPPTNFGQAAGAAGVPPDVAASAPMLQQQQPPQPPGPEAIQQLLMQNQHRQAQLANQNLPVAPSSSAVPPGLPPPAPTAVQSSAPQPAATSAAADPLKRLPIRAYLDQTVVPILLDGTLRDFLLRFRAWDSRVSFPLRVSAYSINLTLFTRYSSTFLMFLLYFSYSSRDVGIGP